MHDSVAKNVKSGTFLKRKKKEKKHKHMLSEASHMDSCAVIKTLNVFLYISQ